MNDNNYTEEDCYMYGVILGDGCLSNKNMNGSAISKMARIRLKYLWITKL